MNAITHNEIRAVDAVTVPLEAADPTKNLILVPLSRLVLRPKSRNVRKTVRMSIPELAASIQRVGLLQNLIVIASADGEHYEVVAGGRRLAALKLLAKKRRISKEWEVPCLLVADGTARTASLTENVQREAMHPADQFEAFAALVAEGRPIEDIAADFSVTPLVVQRRLKLANVSPRLMADYRADAVSLDQLMALAITDDHAAQEAAFYDAPTWQRQPATLRERLTEREIDAYRSPLARFVGLDVYEAAGGGVRRDLFAEADTGVYLSDAALLERLAQEKLAGIASEVKAEGWAWVEAVPTATYADLHAFQRAPREHRAPTKREAQRIDKLQARMQEIDEAIESAIDADDEEMAESLQEESEHLRRQLQVLEDGLLCYGANVLAVAGAVVTIDRNGEAVVHCGLMREAEAKALRTLERLRQGFADGDASNDDSEDTEGAPKSPPVRSAGAAPERAPDGGTANRGGPASACGIGRAGAWHGAVHLAGRPLPPRSSAERFRHSARPAGTRSLRLARVASSHGAARPAVRLGREAARGQRRTVRRVAGDGAGRPGQVAGGMRGGHRGRGDVARCASPARRGTGPGGGPRHGEVVAAHRGRLLPTRFQGRHPACRDRVCAGTRHPVGEAEKGRRCQRGRAAGRWHGLDAADFPFRRPAAAGWRAARRPGARRSGRCRRRGD